MSDDFSLRAYGPLKLGKQPLGNITYLQRDSEGNNTWRRSIDFNAGPWMGTFSIYAPMPTLINWFEQGLGRHIEETSEGVLTWSGMVWEIDLIEPITPTLPNVPKRSRRRRRTLEGHVNRVKAVWQNPSDDSTGQTSWYTDTPAASRYGYFQEVLFLDTDSTAAALEAQDYLAQHATPTPKLVGLEGEVEMAFCEVTVVGYAAAIQGRIITTDDNTQDYISDWVAAIFASDLDSDFFTVGPVATNTRNVWRYAAVDQKVWETLEDLVSLRGPSGEFYQLIITPEGFISYQQWTGRPIGYIWNGAFVDTGYNMLEFRPRIMLPGIYRDLTPGGSGYGTLADYSPIFERTNDFLVYSVEVTPTGELVPRFSEYTHEEALRSFEWEENPRRAEEF